MGRYIGIILALFIAIGAAFMVIKGTGEESPAPVIVQDAPSQPTQLPSQTIESTPVYVAAREIPIGTKIDASMLSTQDWPSHLLVNGFVSGPDQGKQLIGMVARAHFGQDEPIMMSKLANPDDPNFLAATLPKGMRVATMQTDEINGVAGFIFPGDRVDVLVTHRILREDVTPEEFERDRDSEALTEEVTETLLQNVRILAVDQRATAGVEEREGIIIPRSVSLEVSAVDSQRLRLAREVGRLSLALRSIEDRDATETVAITRRPDLSQNDMLQNTAQRLTPVKVIRGIQAVLEERNQAQQPR